MPSLEQLRNEQFADAVERAVAVPFLVSFFTAKPQPLRVRVLMKDGRQLEFQLQEVDLDAHQLVGLDPHDAPMPISLDKVESVWQRRPIVWRSVTVWLSGLLVGIFGGGLIGALLGLLGGALFSWALEDSPAMYEWRQLHGGPAA